MIPESHYHWQWVDTPFGGRNINIFEGRNHIATAFTEAATKKLITALRHSNTTTTERDKVLDELLVWVKKNNINYEDVDGDRLPAIVTGKIMNKIEELRTAPEQP